MDHKNRVIMKIFTQRVVQHIIPSFKLKHKTIEPFIQSILHYVEQQLNCNYQFNSIYKNSIQQNRKAYRKSHIFLPALRHPHPYDSSQITPVLEQKALGQINSHTLSSIDNTKVSESHTNSNINIKLCDESSLNTSCSKPELRFIGSHLLRSVRRCNRNIRIKLRSLPKLENNIK